MRRVLLFGMICPLNMICPDGSDHSYLQAVPDQGIATVNISSAVATPHCPDGFNLMADTMVNPKCVRADAIIVDPEMR
jgi:hypothetical protein